MRYELVIFDFDGTLGDSAGWALEMLGEVSERFGFRNPGPDELEELRGLGSREVIRRLEVPLWKLPLIARHLRRQAIVNAHRFSLFPGIAPMLQRLDDNGAIVAVVSSNAEETIRKVLEPRLAAAIDRFECGASMFGKVRRIRRVLRRSGVPASAAIFIGDETRDIEAAHQAGVAAGAVAWGYSRPAAFADFEPLTRFSTVEEMAAFLA